MMDLTQKQIIRSNEKILRDTCDTAGLIPHLIETSVLTIDDAERIGVLPTKDDKAEKLLRIIETKPNGYERFLEALSAAGQDFLTKRLEETKVDENHLKNIKDEVDQRIREIIEEVFCFSEEPTQYILLENIEEEVRYEFIKGGEHYNIHRDHLRNLVSTFFPKCPPYRRSKTQVWAFRCLKRRRSVEEEDTHLSFPDPCQTNLLELNEEQLAHLLKPHLINAEVPESVLNTILEEEINGRGFLRLELKDIGAVFPYLKKGKQISLFHLKEDIRQGNVYARDEFYSSRDQLFGALKENERFRYFDKKIAPSSNYNKGAILAFNPRSGDLLFPVHAFSMLDTNNENISYLMLADKVVDFVAACLNSRTNGTIHFGVKPNITEKSTTVEGEVIGIRVNAFHCLRQIYKRIDERFYAEQLRLVTQCMRPPQFVRVVSTEASHDNLIVLEVDVVPCSSIVKDEAFFTRSKIDGKPVLYTFDQNGVTSISINDERALTFMSKDILRFSECRNEMECWQKMRSSFY